MGCYGSEERLIDCAYHDFGSTVSMDVSISCGSGEKEAASASQLSSVSAASLSIATICAVAVGILAVVLIAVFICHVCIYTDGEVHIQIHYNINFISTLYGA